MRACARWVLVSAGLLLAACGSCRGGSAMTDAGQRAYDAGAQDAGACVCREPRPLGALVNVVCSDGSVAGPFCGSDGAGCSWQIRNCPSDAGIADAGPQR